MGLEDMYGNEIEEEDEDGQEMIIDGLDGDFDENDLQDP